LKLKKFKLSLIGLIAILAISNAYAGVEVHTFADDEKAEDYKVLVNELRCLVCQNQNLADSNAELAVDLRRQVYEMISNGKSKQDIIDYMVNRYGDFVLYRPPLKSSTLLLWFGPFAILLLGFVILILFVRNQAKKKTDEINDSEQQHIRDILDEPISEIDNSENKN
jgi:cytochrome c-type biogenesis protein CcmH